MSDNTFNSEKIMITLDKPRELKYTLVSFSELEKKFGSLDEAFKSVGGKDKGHLINQGFLLWAGLIHEEIEWGDDGEIKRYTISPTQVLNMVDIRRLTEIDKVMGRAMKLALTDEEKKKVEEAAESDPTLKEALKELEAIETVEAPHKNVQPPSNVVSIGASNKTPQIRPPVIQNK